MKQITGEIEKAVAESSAKASYVAKLEKELEATKKIAEAKSKEVSAMHSEQAALAELELLLPDILPKKKKYGAKTPKPVAVRK